MLVAVHVGAGYHSKNLESQYREAMREACNAGMAALEAGSDRLAAVAAAIAVLEDCDACNAGRGSNLTLGGVVECDASIMDEDGAFGAVGAVPGVTNPIQVARHIAAEGRQPMQLGRVRPMVLVGDAARRWALARGLSASGSPEFPTQWHVTAAALQQWQKYSAMVADAEAAAAGGAAPEADASSAKAAAAAVKSSSAADCRRLAAAPHHEPSAKRQRPNEDAVSGSDAAGCATAAADRSVVHDTVGCVVVDAEGRVAAGVSSGGIAMKADGRLGEAAVFGAGCFASPAQPGDSRAAVAVSVTGVGELIMRAGLAREAAKGAAAVAADLEAACSAALDEGILQAPGQPKDCGVLAVKVQHNSSCGSSSSDCSNGSGGGGGSGNTGGHGSRQQQYHITLAAVHCSVSMGVAYCASAAAQADTPAARSQEPLQGGCHQSEERQQERQRAEQEIGQAQQQQGPAAQQRSAVTAVPGQDDGGPYCGDGVGKHGATPGGSANSEQHNRTSRDMPVHVRFLRQSARDPACPTICRFASSIA